MVEYCRRAGEMSIEKIAILLEIAGIGLEGVVAVIFGERKIREFLKCIASFCHSTREIMWNILQTAEGEDRLGFYIVVPVVTLLDCNVVFGLLYSIDWLFWVGIGGMILAVGLLLVGLAANKEKRGKVFPKRLPQCLIPLYVLFVVIPIPFVLSPLSLILPILISITFETTSFILNFLASRDCIRWVFLGLGIAMILAGLILEYGAIP